MKDEKIFTGKLAVETMEKETEEKEINSENNGIGANWEYIPDWFAISSHFPDKES